MLKSDFPTDGVDKARVLGFAKGSECSGFLLRFFFPSPLLTGVSVCVISPGAANISSLMATGATLGFFCGVRFAFGLSFTVRGSGGDSSSLSELISDDEVELLLLIFAVDGCTWANLHLSPFLHPAGERKNAHGGTEPSPVFLKRVYFLSFDAILNFYV